MAAPASSSMPGFLPQSPFAMACIPGVPSRSEMPDSQFRQYRPRAMDLLSPRTDSEAGSFGLRSRSPRQPPGRAASSDSHSSNSSQRTVDERKDASMKKNTSRQAPGREASSDSDS
eukprot:10094396-Karenia_brevis.AAC.1